MTAAVSEMKQKLVMACRVLDNEGVMDELGHFSVRSPDGDAIMMNGGISPGQVSVEDIILLDMNGKKIEGRLDVPKEYPLHLAVFLKRPDIQAVAHTHPPMTISLSIAGIALRAVDNMGAIVFGAGPVPTYEKYRLVDTLDMGFEIEEAMGPRNIVVLKGYGNIVTGSSIEEACLSAIWAEKAALLQFKAMQVGNPSWFLEDVIEKIRKQFIGGKAHGKALNYYQWRLTR